MKLDTWVNPSDLSKHYHLVINSEELVYVGLNQFDRKLIKECEESSEIADKLLALETITRKIEKQAEEIKNERSTKNS